MESAPSMLDRLRVCLLRERIPMDLDGCAALVPGGSGDIGAAIARALAAGGADVAVTYRHGSSAVTRCAWRAAP
jgi:hypothetical protein